MDNLIGSVRKINGLEVDTEHFIPRQNNNCYTYAINQHVNPYTKEPYESWDYVQPGYLGGKNKGKNLHGFWSDYQNFTKYIKADLNDIGYDLIPCEYEDYIEDPNAWKIAFVYSNWDYHFYRQNTDGTWSHKQGSSYVMTVDDNDNPIYDPRECNRGRYSTFQSFYIIKPLNVN
jgi:hypothetical protein